MFPVRAIRSSSSRADAHLWRHCQGPVVSCQENMTFKNATRVGFNDTRWYYIELAYLEYGLNAISFDDHTADDKELKVEDCDNDKKHSQAIN